ncbi:Spx/MgsR family RNA polymerase-binding regulatory protein [Methylophilaceae bacterium]|nr:Spx/MgsR family RNA polymerase-binding regulatory protein [Methylophilaceae bacterium]
MFCVYGIKNCNTVKKSLEWLNSNKIEFDFFDVKKIDLTTNLINNWINNISSPYTSENLINKTGMTWRKLSGDEKKIPFSKENIINLIQKHPTVMKRPLITDEKKVLVIGFDENIYEEKIK